MVITLGVAPNNLFCLAVKAAMKQVHKKKASVGDAAREYVLSFFQLGGLADIDVGFLMYFVSLSNGCPIYFFRLIVEPL